MFFKQKQYAEAKEYLDKALILSYDIPELLYTKGICLLETNNYEQAINDFTLALDKKRVLQRPIITEPLPVLKLKNLTMLLMI